MDEALMQEIYERLSQKYPQALQAELQDAAGQAREYFLACCYRRFVPKEAKYLLLAMAQTVYEKGGPSEAEGDILRIKTGDTAVEFAQPQLLSEVLSGYHGEMRFFKRTKMR